MRQAYERRPRLTFTDIEAMAAELLKTGMHPSTVRRQLSTSGYRWEYGFVGQGVRERRKRLRAQGLELCRCGQGKRYGTSACSLCLEKKWSAT